MLKPYCYSELSNSYIRSEYGKPYVELFSEPIAHVLPSYGNIDDNNIPYLITFTGSSYIKTDLGDSYVRTENGDSYTKVTEGIPYCKIEKGDSYITVTDKKSYVIQQIDETKVSPDETKVSSDEIKVCNEPYKSQITDIIDTSFLINEFSKSEIISKNMDSLNKSLNKADNMHSVMPNKLKFKRPHKPNNGIRPHSRSWSIVDWLFKR